MEFKYNPKYPIVEDLRKKARKRIPKFVFDYLDGGCNEDINLNKNMSDIREVELMPEYLSGRTGASMKIELFGYTYDAPFGIAPVGLQGLIWPNSAEILAKAAFRHNIPFVLSTTSTSSIERICEITEGRAWFQLYHPTENSLRDKIIRRAEDAGCSVLVVLSDVPDFGYRPRDIRNGLAVPPRITLSNILQVIRRPRWAIQSLIHGQPRFQLLMPYMPKHMDIRKLAVFMGETFTGKLNEQKIGAIRDMWRGKLVLKGVSNEMDAERAIKLGLDGIIVSNHGGRQLDAGESAIHSLKRLAESYSGKIKIMMDSGLRSGPDIARVLASGAEFTFLGRPFMYGAAALGKEGGDHTISILKSQLLQVMEQVCCSEVRDLPRHLITRNRVV
ncbi:MAG TPA: alpha-hydroxy acid oxidase [Puia sp.]|jgi:L-lactate dehydrogenase (cytochrome)